jgi:hypothetical protein
MASRCRVGCSVGNRVERQGKSWYVVHDVKNIQVASFPKWQFGKAELFSNWCSSYHGKYEVLF